MGFLIVFRPRFLSAPERLPGLVADAQAWLGRHGGGFVADGLFAGGGGFAVLDSAPEAEIQRIVEEMPFAPLSAIEVLPFVSAAQGLSAIAEIAAGNAAAATAVPSSIPTALTRAELSRLGELARGRLVLELGSGYGASTVALAQSARRVHAVDWHRGDEQAGRHDTLGPYVANLERHGVADRVVTHIGRFDDAVAVMRPGSFELAFLDGCHDRGHVEADLALVLPLLTPGAAVAFHDYGRYGVTEVVDELAAGGSLEVTDSLAVVRLDP
jgi:predicted O-methyltransferase YrrM